MRVGDGRLERRRGRSRPDPASAPALAGPTVRRAVGHLRDRAAAGPDRHHVDHRQRQRPLADVAAMGQPDAAALDQADVGAGAADVDGDQVLDPACGRDRAGADHAGGRTGQRGQRRGPADRLRAGDAAVRLHQQERRLHLRVAQPLLEPRHVGRDARHHGGVEHGRERALVFADHRQHVDRRRHRHAGQFLAQDLGDAFLMGWIGEGMQQAHRHGLHLQAPALGRRGAHARLVERAQHHPAGADALIDLQHARGRHRAGRLHPGVEIGAARDVLPADGEHMAEARGGDQCGARPLAFQDHVGGDRRAMQHMAEGGRAAPGRSSASIMPAMKACEGSDGTLGVFARQTLPLAGSCSAMSVKVPPISTATAASPTVVRAAGFMRACERRRSDDMSLVEDIDIFIAVERLHGSAGRAQRGGGGLGRPRSPQWRRRSASPQPRG